MDSLPLNAQIFDWLTICIGDIDSIEKESQTSQSDLFRIITKNKIYFLKVSPHLFAEYQRLSWLQDKLLVPRCCGFSHILDMDVVLMEALSGTNLARLSKTLSPEALISLYADAVKSIHTSCVDTYPFGEILPNTVLVHGDACLPNILYEGDVLTGYVDLGDARWDYVEVDLAAAMWSLDYNLGPGFGKTFLEYYGYHTVQDQIVFELLNMYEADTYYPIHPK